MTNQYIDDINIVCDKISAIAEGSTHNAIIRGCMTMAVIYAADILTGNSERKNEVVKTLKADLNQLIDSYIEKPLPDAIREKVHNGETIVE